MERVSTRTEVWLPRLRPVGALLIVAIGVGLGLGLKHDTSSCQSLGIVRVSDVIGWTYFAAWSISFWPQLLMNWERGSVVGLSFDFVLLNFLGFGCYAAYNICLFYLPSVQREYAAAHNGSKSSVKANDVFFAVHALLACTIGLFQIACYERGRQRFSKASLIFSFVFIVSAGIGAATIITKPAAISKWCTLTWFNYVYMLSFIKLGISIVKYIPQVLLNYQRKSTDGWNIDNVMLDFTGGLLSFGQLIMDCACARDWSGISGDPVKFGLGFASMFFDLIFMAQHYVCYRSSAKALEDRLING